MLGEFLEAVSHHLDLLGTPAEAKPQLPAPSGPWSTMAAAQGAWSASKISVTADEPPRPYGRARPRVGFLRTPDVMRQWGSGDGENPERLTDARKREGTLQVVDVLRRADRHDSCGGHPCLGQPPFPPKGTLKDRGGWENWRLPLLTVGRTLAARRRLVFSGRSSSNLVRIC